MEKYDYNNFDYSSITEDEDADELKKEILKLKEQGLTNNIDFEKADEEEKLIQEKQKKLEEEKTSKNLNTIEEELTF